ncbi:hypothetical protein FHR72_003687 [Mycolicibacterium iranicum]|uniref:Uncharacterized protein n=1 Tax=Mycolicibacterium iranicum TaxID=912594 RepID=A0A839QIR6_MYCIR|nr:hypothetical protein [Mycolicibacterium iranicum]MBB2992191.1 hypothetical protein [Mycolicibacterium iranicum]
MTRGQGIYDDEDGSTASKGEGAEKDPDTETPDVDKNTEEPTA